MRCSMTCPPKESPSNAPSYAQWQTRFHTETPLATLNPEDGADWQLIDDQIGLNLLEYDKIQSYKHNPTVAVELIGNALFLPLTQQYAPLDVVSATFFPRRANSPFSGRRPALHLRLRSRVDQNRFGRK